MVIEAQRNQHGLGDALIVTAVLWLGSGNPLMATWQERANMLEARGEHASAVVDGKIHVLTGFARNHNKSFYGEVYDPTTDTWSKIESKFWNFNHTTAGNSVHGTDVWLAGGKYGLAEYSNHVWVYNTQNDTWRRGPDLPEIKWGAPGVVLDDKLYCLGGQETPSKTGLPNRRSFVLDLMDQSAGWSQIADVPIDRIHAAAVALDGKVYFMGGEVTHRHTGDRTEMAAYDPATDTWAMKAPLPQARSHAEWATFVHRGEIWSVNGVDSTLLPRGQKEIWIYTPEKDTWRGFDLYLPKKFVSPGARIVDNTLYVFGGGYNDWWPAKSSVIALDLDEVPGLWRRRAE